MTAKYDHALLAFHDWVTGELGLDFDPRGERWTHEELGLEVRVSVARALLEQGRSVELRTNTVGAMQKKAALLGVRYTVPGVVDPASDLARR